MQGDRGEGHVDGVSVASEATFYKRNLWAEGSIGVGTYVYFHNNKVIIRDKGVALHENAGRNRCITINLKQLKICTIIN